MDPELRRYLNALFVLLVINIGANFAQQSMSLGQGVLMSAISGAGIFVALVEPEWILDEDDEE